MTMTDPLAHLYAVGVDDDVLEEPRTVAVDLDDLTSTIEDVVEELSEHDIAELALLVRQRITDQGLPDAEAVALGLGDFDPDGELILNAAGRAVLGVLIDEDFPGFRAGGGSAR